MLQNSLSEASTEQQPQQQAANAGYVAVKTEYLLPPALSAPQAAETEADSQKQQQQQSEQSKSCKRRPYLPERPAECRSFFADGACQFGAACRLSHDLPAYLASRPPDLGPTCYVFETTGRCSSGLLCRFAGAHVDAHGRNLTDPERQRAWAAAGQSEQQSLDRELQLALRKEDFDFSEAYAILRKRGVQCKGRWAAAASRAEAATAAKANSGLSQLSASPAESSAPTAESTAPAAESSAPTAESTAPAAESSAPTAESTAPAAESSAPTAESTAPAAESSAPTAESTAPAAESSAPTAESTAPAAESSAPTAESTAPAAESPSQTAKPAAHTVGSLALASPKRRVDFRGKLLLAPLTTVGNLPFRRVCVDLGADVTCGEMAMASNLLQGRNAEWALLRRHPSERYFGAQVCGSHPDQLARLAQLLRERAPHLDFVDLNCGCPIDLVYQRGMGAGMLSQPKRLETSVACMADLLACPLTVKVRTGVREGVNVAHELLPRLRAAGAAAVTIHGRSREQRYRRLADWDYIGRCAASAREACQDSASDDDDGFLVVGNGDVFSPADLEAAMATGVDAVMVARGALVKPWLFTELREGRLWDISSSERMDLLRRYVNYGLLHWGSDSKGVETVRRFLLEWQSFLCRYVPVGLLERLPQRSNERPPPYFGRDDLETLMASQHSEDWVRLSTMLLGPPPPGFSFTPKHKASG